MELFLMSKSISWLWIRIQTILQKFTRTLQEKLIFIRDSVANLLIQIKQNKILILWRYLNLNTELQ